MDFPKLDEARKNLARLVGEFKDVNGRIEAGDLSDGLKQRGRNLARATVKAEEEVEALERVLALAADPANMEAGSPGGMIPGQTSLKAVERLGVKDSFADWVRANDAGDGELQAGVTPEQAWGAWFRGFALGDWRDYRGMVRAAMSEGTDSAGGFLVPSVLSANVIDLLRAKTPIFAAGAQVIPMVSKTHDIARISADVTATAWHAESGAIAASDVTLERVRFTAKTLPVLTKASRELAEDAANTGATVARSIAGATAVELTRAALRGDGTSNAPTGIRSTTGVGINSLGTNGAPIGTYDPLIDAIRDVRQENAEPNAAILNPRTEATLSKLRTAEGIYVGPAEPYASLLRFTTTAIPKNLTHGTATTATEAYVGDFRQLLIGMRTQLRIEPLRERFADTGEVAWLSWLRIDVQLEHPKGFVVITGVLD